MARLTPFYLALAFSGLSLVGAFILQYGYGLYPCPICIWQRWPHLAALLLGLAGFYRGHVGLVYGLSLVYAVGAGLALYHVGIEQGWWQAFGQCGAAFTENSVDALKAALLAARPVDCADAGAGFAGLSLAAWNVLLSAGMALYCLVWISKHSKPTA